MDEREKIHKILFCRLPFSGYNICIDSTANAIIYSKIEIIATILENAFIPIGYSRMVFVTMLYVVCEYRMQYTIHYVAIMMDQTNNKVLSVDTFTTFYDNLSSLCGMRRIVKMANRDSHNIFGHCLMTFSIRGMTDFIHLYSSFPNCCCIENISIQNQNNRNLMSIDGMHVQKAHELI